MTVKCRYCQDSRVIFQLPTSNRASCACNVCQETKRAPVESDHEVLELVRNLRGDNHTWREIACLVKNGFEGDWIVDQSSGEHLCSLAGIDRNAEFWEFVKWRQSTIQSPNS